MGRLLFLCWFCLLSATSQAQDSTDRILGATAAWRGISFSGYQSEVAVTLASQGSGIAILRLANEKLSFLREIQVAAGRKTSVRLPFVPDSTSALLLEVTFPGGEQRTHKVEQTVLQPPPRGEARLFVGATEADTTLPQLSVQHLPENYLAYDWVDSLHIGSAELARLNSAQRQVLLNYAAECRALVISGASAAWLARISMFAGCDGSMIFSADNEIPNHAARLLPAHRLRSLLGEQRSTMQRLNRWKAPLFFLGLYGLLMIYLLSSGKSSRYLMGAAALFAVAALLLWRQFAPEVQSVAWVELTPGTKLARGTSLLQIRGQGRWSGRIAMAVDSGLPIAVRPGEASVQLSQKVDETAPSLITDTLLFSTRVLAQTLIVEPDAFPRKAKKQTLPMAARQILMERGLEPGSVIYAEMEQSRIWLATHSSNEAGQ